MDLAQEEGHYLLGEEDVVVFSILEVSWVELELRGWVEGLVFQ